MSLRITNLGIQVLTATDIFNALKAEYESIDGGFDLSPSSLDGNKLEIDTAALFEVQAMIEAMVHIFDVGSAKGHNLVNLARSIAGGAFNHGSNSICSSVVFGGTAGARILSGEKLTDASGKGWTLTTGGVVGDSLHAIADTIGAHTLSVGDLNIINNPIVGITSVTNTLAGVVGTHTDSESVLRRKLTNSPASFNRNGLDALYSEVGRVSGVFDVRIPENRASSVVNGLDPHSVAIIVHGGATQDLLNAVAMSIACGVSMNVGVSGTGIEVTGQGITKAGRKCNVTFFRAVTVPVAVVVTVSGSVADQTLTDNIKANIVAYAEGRAELLPLSSFDQDGLLIGEDVHSFRIATPVNASLAGNGYITDLTVNGSSQVTVNDSSIGVITESSITVTYI